MVSNSAVTRLGLRQPIQVLIAAAIFAVLYKYWLTIQVLQYFSISRWRLLAVVIAAVCGGALSLLRFSTTVVSVGVIGGLLLGGTWAAWTAPHDVTISASYAFTSHLELLWREVVRLSFAAILTSRLCGYFAKPRAKVR